MRQTSLEKTHTHGRVYLVEGILGITGRGRSIGGEKQVANATFGAQSVKAESPSLWLATSACAGLHRRAKRKHCVKNAVRHGSIDVTRAARVAVCTGASNPT